MPLASWLFIKQEQSIWVERPYGCALIVAGPGTAREQHDFPDERALDAYQVSLAERLTEGGWFLWAFDRDRRSGRERRIIARNATDRRQQARR
jgi:hypothetical protein